jgi:ribonuclease BN (tRNA processing enzyme)
MRLKVIGASGAEFPDDRLPAFLIDGKLLLDAGTICSSLSPVEQWKIRHVLLTHTHLDHMKGLPFLADNVAISGKKHRVNVYSTSAVLRLLKRHVLNWRIWPDFTVIPTPENGVLRLTPVRAGSKFKVEGYTVTAYNVEHSVPAVGFVVEDSKGGGKLLYTGDTGPTSRLWRAVDSSMRCAIVEVSFPNSMEDLALRAGHLTAALLKDELLKMKAIPDRILITHPKPQHRAAIKRELSALRMRNIQMLSGGEEFDI